MKRVLSAAVQALVLFSLSLFLGWQYLARGSNRISQKDAENLAIPYFTSTIPPFRVPAPTSVTEAPDIPNSETQTQEEGANAKNPPLPFNAVTPDSQYVEPSSNVPHSTASPSPSPASTTELKLPDPKLLEQVPRFIQAIMNPEDTSFNRLSCQPPTGDRYNYLKPTSSAPSGSAGIKYFFTLDLYQCAPLLPRLLGSIVETIRFLGPENCALSIVEGRSTDGTFEILKSMQGEIENLGAKYYFSTNEVNPKAGENVDRIKTLADLRNQALQPLIRNPQNYAPDSSVIFINDVSLCMEDILELVHQRIYQKADMTCAMDWIFGGGAFYDVWVARGMNGDQFFEIPQSATWDFMENLFWNDEPTRARFDAGRSFQTFACWNGATAFTAKPLLDQKIKFRSHYKNECFMGEPTHFCKDMWHEGYGKIAVVPSVNVGYDDEESAKIKTSKGSVAEWIEWKIKPPPMIKCVPTYQKPSWVPSDEGLKPKKKETKGSI